MSKVWWVPAEPFQVGLSEGDRHRLLQLMHPTRYEAGKVIYSSALPGDVIYWIQQGQVELFQTTPVQTRRLLCKLDHGALFGSLGLVEAGYKNALALTTEACTLLVLRKNALEQLMRYFPDTAARVVELLQQEQQQLVQVRIKANAKKTYRRLCRLLSHFLDQPAYVVGGEALRFSADPRELSEQLACRPEAVTLCLNYLEERGMISRQGQVVQLRDRAALLREIGQV